MVTYVGVGSMYHVCELCVYSVPGFDRIGNSEPDRIGANLAGTGPDFTISKIYRIETDGRICNRILQK